MSKTLQTTTTSVPMRTYLPV